MEMIKKLYFFDALSDEAKEKAREWYRDIVIDENPFLEGDLTNIIKEKLEDRGFEVVGKYKDGHETGNNDLTIFYSLSHCQGDGVSFEGTLKRDGLTYHVKQSGHYYHEYSLDVTASDEDGESVDFPERAIEDMRAACKETERVGYDEIAYLESNENVDEAIRANEYTFSKDGERMNPDKE